MLPVVELIEQPLDREEDELGVGIEVLVDRGADDQHDVLGLGDGAGSVVASSRSVPIRRSSSSSAPFSQKGILPARDAIDGLGVAVVERDREAGVGQHQTER